MARLLEELFPEEVSGGDRDTWRLEVSERGEVVRRRDGTHRYCLAQAESWGITGGGLLTLGLHNYWEASGGIVWRLRCIAHG